MKRYAFSMLELIFVIVIMGVIGKFGVEFLAKAYQNFIFSSTNNTLQSNSATAIEFISTRLQHRIKDSIIARIDATNFDPLADVNTSSLTDYKILEWVGSDIEGFRGNSKSTPNLPNWSGIIDVDHATATVNNLVSPGTDTGEVGSLISVLSYTDKGVDNAAIYFLGATSDVMTDFGWSGNSSYMEDQNGSMHPIKSGGAVTEFAPASDDFDGVYISEYYKLAWSAYAISLDNNDNLWFHYDYQPWSSAVPRTYDHADTKKALLMKNVDTFKFSAIGSVVKVQICVNSDLVEDYSLCKEKTIY